jgi:hypothetical protein
MAPRKTKTVYLSQLDEVAIQWPGDIRTLAEFLLHSGDAKAREMNAKNPGLIATSRPTVHGLVRHFANLTEIPSSRVEQELESRGFSLGALVEFDPTPAENEDAK